MQMRWINFKIMFERMKMYVAWVQFVMIGWLFIIQTKFNLWMTLLLVALSLGLLSFIDFKWILPAELNKMAEKNPVIMAIKRDVEKIREEMKTTRR